MTFHSPPTADAASAAWLEERIGVASAKTVPHPGDRRRLARLTRIYGDTSAFSTLCEARGWAPEEVADVLESPPPFTVNESARVSIDACGQWLMTALGSRSADAVGDLARHALWEVRASCAQLPADCIADSVWQELADPLSWLLSAIVHRDGADWIPCDGSPDPRRHPPLALDAIVSRPVLVRLLHSCVRNWVRATCELLMRFAHDATVHAPAAPLQKPLVHVDGFWSDLHDDGRAVTVLRTGSGRRLVYKPRDPHAHLALSKLLIRLEELGLQAGLRVPGVMVGNGYGWHEWVEHRSCTSMEEVVTFFTRVGALLCVLYVLDGTDVHAENLVAAGPDPVLVDVECLFTNRPRILDASPSPRCAWWNERSVLATGLLPVAADDRQAVLGYAVEAEGNTASTRGCRLHGTLVPPARFADAICEGFSTTYAFMVIRRMELKRALRSLFEDTPVRFTARPTASYTAIRDRLLESRFHQDGRDFSVELELLAAEWSTWSRTERSWLSSAVLDEERRALRSLNVPIFWSHPSMRHLYRSDGGIVEPSYFATTAMTEVLGRIDRMSSADAQYQVSRIRDSLAHRYR